MLLFRRTPRAPQVEVGQLDELTGLSSKSVGNLTYWLLGGVLHATLDLRDGVLAQPLSLYVATAPPTGPPPLLDAEVHALLLCFFWRATQTLVSICVPSLPITAKPMQKPVLMHV